MRNDTPIRSRSEARELWEPGAHYCRDDSTRLNELELIDGETWANVWGTTWIARIDPATGRVRRWVDASSILHADPRGSDQNPANGIAYDSTSRRILITGKRWAHIYAVEPR